MIIKRLSLAVAACLALIHPSLSVAQKDIQMTGQTRTWCVGRYNIDLPVAFELQSIRPNIGAPRGVRVTGLGPGDAYDLEALVDARRTALEIGTREQPYFQAAGQLRLDDIFILGRKQYDPLLPSFKAPSVDAEAYYISHGHMFRAEADAFLDLTDVLKLGDDPHQVGLATIAQATEPRENEDVPNRSGICVDRAFIDLADMTADSVTVRFRDPSVFFVGFSLFLRHVSSWPVGSDIYLESTPFFENRKVAGVQGLVGKEIDPNLDRWVFEYSGGEDANGRSPQTEIRMSLYRNEVSIDAPPYDVKTLEGIWDTALNSLRLR